MVYFRGLRISGFWREISESALAWGAETVGVVDSGLPGPKGNREFVLHLEADDRPQLPAALNRWIDDAAG